METDQIKHVVVLMLENPSFDQMLGWMGGGVRYPGRHRETVGGRPEVRDRIPCAAEMNPMVKLYHYVGPQNIQSRVTGAPPGMKIESVHDLNDWLHEAEQQQDRQGEFAVTFVVDEQGSLRVADRGSEHVACAGGGPVLSAGEMFLVLSEDCLRVGEISNQSTGYCPEPESWPAVVAAVERIGLPHPGRFTQEIIFRRCPACGERSIVKDGWFVCGLCGADLPATWNF